jgi:MFS family permease
MTRAGRTSRARLLSGARPGVRIGRAARPRRAQERRGASRMRGRLELLVTAIGGFIVALCGTIIVPIMPEITHDMDTSLTAVSWSLTATTLASAVSVPLMGRLGDMYGKRKLLLVALCAAVAGSLICALSGDIATLIAGRTVLGLSNAAIPLGISLLSELLPPDQESSGIALISAMLGIGGALGLPLAGAVAGNFDYHLLFWLTGAVSLIATVGVLIVVPESRIRAPGRLDLIGSVILAVTLTALLLPLAQGSSWGWGSPLTLGLVSVSLLLAVALVRFELRHDSPTVDVRAAAKRPILLTNIATVLVGFSLFASFVGTAAYVQAPEATGYGFGVSVFIGGLAMLPGGLMMLFISPFAARVIDRYGAKLTLLVGCAIIAFGFLLRIFVYQTIWLVVLGATVGGVGSAIAYAAMPKLILQATVPEEKAAANGLNALARYLGNALASAAGAGVQASLVVLVAAEEYPSLAAYNIIFVASAAAAVLAAVCAYFVPEREPLSRELDRVAPGPAITAAKA